MYVVPRFWLRVCVRLFVFVGVWFLLPGDFVVVRKVQNTMSLITSFLSFNVAFKYLPSLK
jgi:hypothetical protein